MKIFNGKSKKIISVIIIITALLSFGVYWFLFKNKEPNFVFQKVVRGAITQEVSETGSVKVSEKRDLSFKNSGRIKEMYVNIGDNVETGQFLAKLDTTQLYIELDEAKADSEVAKAKNTDADVSLQNAEQSLEDAKSKADEDMDNAYDDALTVLDDSYLKTYNAYNVVYKIQRDYFTSFDEKSTEVVNEKYNIKSDLERIKTYVNDAKNNSQEENIDSVLLKVKEQLEAVSNSLEVIRDDTKSEAYRALVSSADKTSLDTQRTNINNVTADIVNAQQDISTVKITNKTNINNAQAEISSLENKLQGEGLYRAQIKQGEAKIKLLENKITQAVLKAPENGQITDINKREGEMAQPADSVISFLPAAPFQVEVNIYEEDIVKIKIGDPVNIDLTPFPGQAFEGKVISIDPAEKLIEGVVYYKVIIDFLKIKEGIKPGMTADIIIKTAEKDNVLRVPKELIEKTSGQKIVRVYENGEVKPREIETGLEGEDFVEITSGLEEGEKVL